MALRERNTGRCRGVTRTARECARKIGKLRHEKREGRGLRRDERAPLMPSTSGTRLLLKPAKFNGGERPLSRSL